MKKFNNKSGFTLIEIIVVLIIVGILAAIALPNLFSNIKKSNSSQALTALDGVKTNLETCMAGPSNSGIAPGAPPCNTANLATPSNANGWTYTIPVAAVAQSPVLGAVVAPASGALGKWVGDVVASDGTNTIVLSRAATGVYTCSIGTASPYLGVC